MGRGRKTAVKMLAVFLEWLIYQLDAHTKESTSVLNQPVATRHAQEEWSVAVVRIPVGSSLNLTSERLYSQVRPIRTTFLYSQDHQAGVETRTTERRAARLASCTKAVYAQFASVPCQSVFRILISVSPGRRDDNSASVCSVKPRFTAPYRYDLVALQAPALQEIEAIW